MFMNAMHKPYCYFELTCALFVGVYIVGKPTCLHVFRFEWIKNACISTANGSVDSAD